MPTSSPAPIEAALPPALRPQLPAYLIAYPFISHWYQRRGGQRYRNWIMDSGAFSANTSGKAIKLDDYHRGVEEALASPDPPRYVFGLDVIGDWRASIKNVEQSWKRGIEAIPTYHQGEPEAHLVAMAKDYPMIAIGGVANQPNGTRLSWAKECFARIWPKKVHGFSLCSRMYALALPFFSVDSTAWFLQAIRYHRFVAHRGAYLPRARLVSLRAEIDAYLKLEELVRLKWKAQMAELGDADGPTLYLANPHGNGPAWEGPTGFEVEPAKEALAHV